MNNKLFSSILILLFILGLGIFILPQKDVSLLEKRDLAKNNSISLLDFSSTVETVLKDQFYARDQIVQFYYKLKMAQNKSFGSTSIDGVDMEFLSNEVIQINDNYLLLNTTAYDANKAGLSASKGYNVIEFAEAYPEMDVYVYLPIRMEEILDNGQYLNLFRQQINDKVTLKEMKMDSLKTFEEYYFKSDFHWRHTGAYQGYKDVIEMIRQDFEIDAPREIEEEIIGTYPWRGNISAKVGLLGDTDLIGDYRLKDIGSYDYMTNGNLNDLHAVKEQYLQNGNSTEYSDYDIYFGDNYFERVFDFHQEDKPNLLIFADSYINVNQEWIASHFNKTYILDLRAKPQDFLMNPYLEGKDIDCVLILQFFNNLFFNGEMFLPLS